MLDVFVLSSFSLAFVYGTALSVPTGRLRVSDNVRLIASIVATVLLLHFSLGVDAPALAAHTAASAFGGLFLYRVYLKISEPSVVRRKSVRSDWLG